LSATVFERRNVWLVALDAGVWAVWSTLCGYLAHRVPVERLRGDGFLFRVRRVERPGRLYERVWRIKRWKGLLPEAGALFKGGFSKRRVVGRDREYLERFAVETRRAELTHWLVMSIAPLFFLWNPWWLALAMVGYALAANLPCLLTQRYNRARLMRMLARRGVARATSDEEEP
jgi:glycosyl-4,4'-diaponeurosporenoate acyltransferase